MNQLEHLCLCSSTPGDEGAVFDYVSSCWNHLGWTVDTLASYARIAYHPRRHKGKPKLLITAHADSPGYIVDALEPPHAIAIGSPHAKKLADSDRRLQARLNGKYAVEISADPADEQAIFIHHLPEGFSLSLGDRICWEPSFKYTQETQLVEATFLDNRIGCWLTIKLAEHFFHTDDLPFEVVLAITSSEEFTGFGAKALAEYLKPDFVIALDATYEAPRQNVLLGGGPVLTISDKSVLLSPRVRDRIKHCFAKHQLPLQFEVYNYSGTDARAFPPATVISLLIPTRGNHSPLETADWRDIEALRVALETLSAELFLS